MSNSEKRMTRRFQVALKVMVSDLERTKQVRCMVRDASPTGCQLISVNIQEFPDFILVKVPALDQWIKGKIMWRKFNTAGVEFQWEAVGGDDRRGARRMSVNMPVDIYGRDLKPLTSCVMCDASRTGCRIRGADIGELPAEICISIPRLTAPVQAEIVWCTSYEAGIRFEWDASRYSVEPEEAVFEASES